MWGEKKNEEKDDGSARGGEEQPRQLGDVRSGRDCGGRYSRAVPATCCFPADFCPYKKAKKKRGGGGGGDRARIAAATWAFLRGESSQDSSVWPSEMLADTGGPVSTP